MTPVRPDHPTAPGALAARRSQALASRLRAMGVVTAPAATPELIARMEEQEALLAQFVRAARHSSGTVRAFASLIADAHEEDADTGHWVSRIERTATELDDFSARMGALRVCDNERASKTEWSEVLSRVASRCAGIAPRAIEVNDRSRGSFLQRAELLGRAVFHLVRNAMEASPRGAGVRIRVDELREEGARVFHVRVSDEGPGIDATVAETMWDPFVTTRPGHAGLGLAYVRAVAPVLGAAIGMRRESERTTAHMLVGEEGGLQWE